MPPLMEIMLVLCFDRFPYVWTEHTAVMEDTEWKNMGEKTRMVHVYGREWHTPGISWLNMVCTHLHCFYEHPTTCPAPLSKANFHNFMVKINTLTLSGVSFADQD
jgi:hypothetical protein